MAPKTTKKPVTRKRVVKTAAAAPEAAAPMAACSCGCGCGCCGSRFGRFLKKLIVFLVIFALGYAAAKFIPCGKFHRGPRFENGCMDISKIKCPKMLERVAAMDMDANGCVSREEFRAMKGEWNKGGCKKCGCGKTVATVEEVEVVEFQE